VHSVEPTGETLPAYNFRVAGDHTYFVGSPAWGFSLWAHNACFIDRPNLFREQREAGANRVLVLGTPQFTGGANSLAHAREIMRQVDAAIAREGNKISYIVLNRSMRTAVGRGFASGPDALKRPDITIVYKPSAGGGVSVREIGSDGQSLPFLTEQQAAALASLDSSIRDRIAPRPTLFGDYSH
jgi:hypothetical protein